MMRRALKLAAKGAGRTSPNPLVGAVIVMDGEQVADGFHGKFGGPHAERVALDKAGERARGATLFTTLEPCAHFGSTPPCVEAIVEAGITKVVMAMIDPDPRVAGRGLKALERAGLEVETGVEEKRAMELNSHYVMHRTQGRPLVTYKTAITLDGRTSARDGSSRWITGEVARADAHRLRAVSDAICVGVGTVLADDPKLTSRVRGGRNPLRVIMDSNNRIPETANVRSQDAETIVFDRVEIPQMLKELAQRGVMSLLLEGGPTVAGAFTKLNLVDRFVFYVAPKLLGDGGPVLGRWAVETIGDALELEITSVRKLGSDVKISACLRA